MDYDFYENFFNTLLTLSAENKTIKNADTLGIRDFRAYDGKTVVVNFNDGTKTYAVCSDNDEFDLRQGIEVCLLKKAYGDNVHSMVDKLIRSFEADVKYEEEIEKLEREERAREEKRRAKRHAKKVKRLAKMQLEIEQAKKELAEKKIINE